MNIEINAMKLPVYGKNLHLLKLNLDSDQKSLVNLIILQYVSKINVKGNAASQLVLYNSV